MTAVPNELNPSRRILLGPGPSNVHPRVLRAMATPLVGHMDPEFIELMEEVKALLRAVFQTENEMTFPVSGTGSAGMETCLVNLLEPGEEILVCINGVFGMRMAEVAKRCGATVHTIETEWGKVFEPEQVKEALSGINPAVVAVVHAETSTGACQPLKPIADLAHEAGALFLADMVTSLGGMPVELDANGVDAAYSGSQKCLSCPPGLAPVSFNEKAMAKITGRSTTVQSWYLDVTLLNQYWGSARVYHHTEPISMNYALREALRLVAEEGLEARFARHRDISAALGAGLQALGLGLISQEGHRLPMMNTVTVPEGADAALVQKRLLSDYKIEVLGGLGRLAGKSWRVGLMGHSGQIENVVVFLTALEEILTDTGALSGPMGAAGAAAKKYRETIKG